MAAGLGEAVALLAAGVGAGAAFKRAGLGAVLGYFLAGVAVGPFGLRVIAEPEAVLHVAELGVVLFLFLVGLEMAPARLWALRRDIFGLGLAQVGLCALLLTGVGLALGLPPAAAFVAGAGFVLSSTAVVMQMLEERGEAATPEGRQGVAILLLEDLAIVPLLAVVAFLGPVAADAGPGWVPVATAAAALAALLAAGRWLLDPLFGLLAAARARDVMTAAALLVVLGSAFLLDAGGLSAAMGAFVAGVLLSRSSFRHQLEADVEPFRGVLLGLFFLAVGMSLDLAMVAAEWRLTLAVLVLFMTVKAAAVYGVARAFGSGHDAALTRAALFAQGGEFAFVLYAAALAVGVLDARLSAVLGGVVILSMALTPLIALARGRPRAAAPSMDGVEPADGLAGEALVIGFGRFAQVACQLLLARGVTVSIIENDVEMIRAAARFGFKVYYGDGGRLDVLRASGAERAALILVCVDDKAAGTRIVELCKAEFPHARVHARAYDRGHALELIRAEADFHIRETFESAMAFGAEALRALGVDEAEVDDHLADVRRRDAERLQLQLTGGIAAGRDLMRGNMPTPEPLTRPAREGAVVGAPGATPDAPRAMVGGAGAAP